MSFKHSQKKCFSLLLLCAVISSVSAEDSEDIKLPAIVTYIDEAIVEQRQVYSSEEIEMLHIESLPALLQAAGIQLLSYGAYGLQSNPSIRGFTDETVRVIINGLCVNNAQYGTFDFTSINLNEIEKIEIVRGGFTEGTSDEGAVGGAIYITTKKQTLGHHFLVESSIKSYLNQQIPLTLDTFSQKLGYNGQIGNNSFFKANLHGTFANNQFLYAQMTKQQLNSHVLDGGGDANFTTYFGNGSSFSVSELIYAGDKQIPGFEYNRNIGNQKDVNNKITLNLTNPSLFGNLKLENNLAWFYDNRSYNSQTEHSLHKINTVKYAGIADFYKFDHYRQSLGITLDFVNLDSTNDGRHIQFSGAIKETSKIKINDILSFSVPMAVKFSGQNFAFTPKLGIRLDFSHVAVLWDGYRMTQFPNMDDLYWNGGGGKGNPELKPESGWGSDFTVNVHHIPLPFSLCIFTNYYENKIKWANENNTWMPKNIASAFYLGTNLSTEQSFFDGVLFFRASAEYLYTALLDENNTYEYKKRIMLTPDLVVSGSFTLNLDAISMTVDGNYVGKRFVSNMNISFLEPYFLLNAVCELKTFTRLKPFIRGENLLNWNYQCVENYPMPGLSITVGASWKY